jgi:lipopolysaccharide cholinephosphotransferase
MTGATLQEFKKILIETFQYLIGYLEVNNIPYFAIGGTALGAIRHQGMIPWDDDVDILIPRKDYDRLFTLNKDVLLKDGYSFVSLEDEGYYLPYAKFCNNRTTIWEVKKWPFLVGAWVDIFPLDYVDISYTELVAKKKKMMSSLYKYQSSIADGSFKDVFKQLMGGHAHLTWNAINALIYKKKNASKYLEKFNKYLREFTVEKGEHCTLLFGVYGERDYFPSKWFDSYKLLNFEGYQIRVPEQCEEYLTFLFGDYMKLPPESEREPKHNLYYCNLKERKSLEDVKKEIKGT